MPRDAPSYATRLLRRLSAKLEKQVGGIQTMLSQIHGDDYIRVALPVIALQRGKGGGNPLLDEMKLKREPRDQLARRLGGARAAAVEAKLQMRDGPRRLFHAIEERSTCQTEMAVRPLPELGLRGLCIEPVLECNPGLGSELGLDFGT